MANRVLVSVQDGIPEPVWIGNVESFVLKVLNMLSFDGEEISILFCDNVFIRELNKNYRDIDMPTDVLSFENGEEYDDEDGSVWKEAGDIAISVEMVSENAKYFDIDDNDELKRLLVHGVLHLNGMDHGEEHIEPGKKPKCEMLVIQENLLEKIAAEKIM